MGAISLFRFQPKPKLLFHPFMLLATEKTWTCMHCCMQAYIHAYLDKYIYTHTDMKIEERKCEEIRGIMKLKKKLNEEVNGKHLHVVGRDNVITETEIICANEAAIKINATAGGREAARQEIRDPVKARDAFGV